VCVLAIVAIFVSPIFRYAFEIIFGNWYAPYVLMPSRSDALMFGFLIALIVRNERALGIAKRWRYAFDAITIFLAVQISVDGSLMRVWSELPGGRFPPLKQSFLALMFAILRAFLYDKSWISAKLRSSALGKIGAYALYMYHQGINGIHGYFFNSEPIITSLAQLFAAVCVVTVTFMLAAVSYGYLEMPIRRRAQDFTKGFREDSPSQNGRATKEFSAWAQWFNERSRLQPLKPTPGLGAALRPDNNN
jgi:peptidoglycan/LPS O-acetylase OafA/YrhL